MRRLALALARLAAWLLPPARAEWAEAMRAELHYIDSDRRAVWFALGFLFAGLEERVNAMQTLDRCTADRLNIAVALLFAVLYLAGTWLLKGTRWLDPVQTWLLVSWLLPFGYLSACKRRRAP